MITSCVIPTAAVAILRWWAKIGVFQDQEKMMWLDVCCSFVLLRNIQNLASLQKQ